MSEPFTFEYFAEETITLRDIWSDKTAWDGFGDGNSRVERAMHGWSHMYFSCLDTPARNRAESIFSATLYEYELRAKAILQLATLDALCEGHWQDESPKDRAFALGFWDAAHGVKRHREIPLLFVSSYEEGHEAYRQRS